jgi:hypothetical protein
MGVPVSKVTVTGVHQNTSFRVDLRKFADKTVSPTRSEAMAIIRKRARASAEKQAEDARAKLEEREQQEAQTGKKLGGFPPKVPDPDHVEPDKKAQCNFTDPDSRIMLDGASKSFTQAYNAQIAVDGDNQVIVAAAVTQEANDVNQLLPMSLSEKRFCPRIFANQRE